MRQAAGLRCLRGRSALAGCGGRWRQDEPEEGERTQAQAACDGGLSRQRRSCRRASRRSRTVDVDEAVDPGPDDVVEGYLTGDVKEAHDEYQKELTGARLQGSLRGARGRHDSEVLLAGPKGRTGQVAIRDECGERDKTLLHITNRSRRARRERWRGIRANRLARSRPASRSRADGPRSGESPLRDRARRGRPITGGGPV